MYNSIGVGVRAHFSLIFAQLNGFHVPQLKLQNPLFRPYLDPYKGLRLNIIDISNHWIRIYGKLYFSYNDHLHSLFGHYHVYIFYHQNRITKFCLIHSFLIDDLHFGSFSFYGTSACYRIGYLCNLCAVDFFNNIFFDTFRRLFICIIVFSI